MSLYAVVLLAIALSMDAFAVAVASGCSLRSPRPSQYLRLSAAFGFFQFFMPVVGWYLGQFVRGRLEAWDHWIAFGLLAWVGGSMLRSAAAALKKRETACPAVDPTAGRNLLLLSLATSIDALAVGLSFAMLQQAIWGPAMLIGVICAAITACGVFLGKTLARLCTLSGWAELLGGLTLLGIACNILREHHVFG